MSWLAKFDALAADTGAKSDKTRPNPVLSGSVSIVTDISKNDEPALQDDDWHVQRILAAARLATDPAIAEDEAEIWLRGECDV